MVRRPIVCTIFPVGRRPPCTMSALNTEMECENTTTNQSAAKGKPRYRQKPKNGNSRARKDDAFRLKVGKKINADYRAQRLLNLLLSFHPTSLLSRSRLRYHLLPDPSIC